MDENEKKRVSRARNKHFENIYINIYILIAGIHSIFNCVKFKYEYAIFYFSRLPKNFDSKLQQTNTKTDESEMRCPLYFPMILSCVHHLTLTAVASVAKTLKVKGNC